MNRLSQFVENIWPDTQAVFRRFPLAIFMVALFTLSILDLSWWKIFSDEILQGIVGGTILAAYLAVNLTLIGEGHGKHASNIIKAIVCVTALIACYFFREIEFLPQLAIGAAILFLGSAPFWRQPRNDVGVWDFTHKVWTAVIFTVAGAVIYLLGLLAIMAALKSLFGVNIDDLLQKILLPIGLGFLAPACWLSMLPAHDDDEGDSLRNPGFISKAVGFLGTWILAPLTLIYAIILIAYGIKIALAGALPNGEVAELVTPFLIIGTLTWLILDPPFIQEKRLARWYHKVWFPLTIPAALLLAVAVFQRINQYGFTVERYLLVLASVWALGIALWFTFRPKEKRDIRIIPGFAALLLAVASIGPWGADQFSSINQKSRLTQALNVNNMLDENGYLKPEADLVIVDKDAAQKAKGSLRYLVRQQKRNRIKSFFAKDDTFELEDDSGSRKWLDDRELLKRFKLQDVKIPNRYGGSYDQYNYYDNAKTFDISGFEKMVTGQHVNFSPNGTYETKMSIGSYGIVSQGGFIRVKYNEQIMSEFEAFEWLNTRGTLADNKLDLDPRQVLYSSTNTEIAIHVTNANVNKGGENRQNASAGMQFMILGKGVELEPAKPNP
jgi:hypothetical protein